MKSTRPDRYWDTFNAVVGAISNGQWIWPDANDRSQRVVLDAKHICELAHSVAEAAHGTLEDVR